MSAGAPDSSGDLAARLRTQAEHCANGGSPPYAGLLERAAVDLEAGGPVARLLRGHESDPADSVLPLRMMGVVHRRVLEGRLPELEPHFVRGAMEEEAWRAFRSALADDEEALRRLLNRPVQTNEVGRCVALLPGFLRVATATGLPMRVPEVGASAGLNLRWDRYRYESDGFGWGDPAAPVRLRFDLSGPAPETAAVDVVERRGCDRRPLDPLGEEGRLMLLSFGRADQPQRLQRLRAALEAARETPLAVERAGAADWIASRLAERREGVATVVVHSIVMQYLAAGERAEVRLMLWPGGEDLPLARAGYHGDVLEMHPA